MRIAGCSAIFNRRGFCMLFLFAVAGIVGWRVSAPVPVSAQAKTKVNPKDGLTYVWIPPGTFQMGCSPEDSECRDAEKPAHSVTLTTGFWLSQTLVTQTAYTKLGLPNPSEFKGDKLPVDNIPWDVANAYCIAVDMRLPTEAEWEYAARGGSPAIRYAPIDSIAWYNTNSMHTTHEVGQKQANAYGLYDMLGNVWEWVADWYAPYTAADIQDPRGPTVGPSHVLRGGSFGFVAARVRVSIRGFASPVPRDDGADSDVGFRCAGD